MTRHTDPEPTTDEAECAEKRRTDTRNAPETTRRRMLQASGGAILPLSSLDGLLDTTDELVNELIDDTVDALPALFGETGRRINELRYPLSAVPQIREPGETLRVELDVPAGETDAVEATLRPSHGVASTETALELEGVTTGSSEIWDDDVLVAAFSIPNLDRQFTEGMYDLEVAFDGNRPSAGGTDGQPRAVSVVESFPEQPTVAIMGDPHVGDPRALEDGFEDSLAAGSPEPFFEIYTEMIGTGTRNDRWGQFRRAVYEINAMDPDLVFVIGDLTFGSPSYLVEYEDAYRLFNLFDAPTFTVIGNHDGYVSPGTGIDGKDFYERYFAPHYYSVDIRPGLRFVSIDSYDWRAMNRIAPSAVPSTWGGQVRDEQLEWLESDLRDWRADTPDGTLLSMSHHNPSWRQTASLEPTEGVPAVEQITRGATMEGGGWVGENRLAVRDLLAEVDVAMHVSGHAHRDRLARYHDGDVVATTGSGLEYVTPDGDRLDREESFLEETLRSGDGTLFVEATTAGSHTGQYWGWRTIQVGTDGVDPAPYGYPASESFLEAHAGDGWTTDEVHLGLYSTPSYRFDVELLELERHRVAVRLENELARTVEGALTLPLGACNGIRVEGGRQQWRRSDGDRQDVRVAFDVPAESTHTVAVECVSREPGSPGR